MTDTETGAEARAPRITRNIRAELARAGLSATEARMHLDMARSTWDARMANPGLWRLSELDALAGLLQVRPATLVMDS